MMTRNTRVLLRKNEFNKKPEELSSNFYETGIFVYGYLQIDKNEMFYLTRSHSPDDRKPLLEKIEILTFKGEEN